MLHVPRTAGVRIPQLGHQCQQVEQRRRRRVLFPIGHAAPLSLDGRLVTANGDAGNPGLVFGFAEDLREDDQG